MNLRAIHKALVLFLLLVSMLMPAKMGMGQRSLIRSFQYPTLNWSSEAALFHSDGNIYIGMESPQRASSASIDVYDRNGYFVRSLDLSGLSTGLIDIHAMCERPNGNILVGEFFGNRIWEFTTTGAVVRFIPFNSCQSLTSLPDGGIVAIDHSDQSAKNGRVVILNSDGTERLSFVCGGNPTQALLSTSGVLHVTSPGEGLVKKYTLDGVFLGSYGQDSSFKLRLPIKIAQLNNGLIIVAQWLHHPGTTNLAIYSEDGIYVGRFDTLANGVPVDEWAMNITTRGDYVLVTSDQGLETNSNYRPIFHLFVEDKLSPTSTFSASPSTTWSNSNVTAAITSTDNSDGSGVKEIHYTVNMGAEQVVTGSSASFTLTEEGIQSIAYWAVDNAGNVEATKYATVRIDKTPPTVDGYVVSGKLMLMASDLRSGVAGIKYSLDGAAAADYSAPLTIPAGAHTYSYWSVDNAGNESVKETILVGSTVSVTIAPTSVYASKAAVATIKLSVAAPAGGVTVMLSSDNPAVTIAPSVKFNAGATTINVPVQTGAVAADTSVVITASIGGSEAYGTLTVLVPFPKTLTIAPNVITGGNNAVGTITLQSNAPAGGQVVTLTSMHPDVTVPASVTVPAGALTATFSVSTKIAARDYSAAIDAEADGAGVGTTVLVKRVTPKSVTFAPSSIVGGNTSVGTVTLNVAAPTGGATVMLKSTSTFVTVPTSVTVAEGQTTATFDIATSVTARTVLANVQATAAGVRVAGVLTVSGVNVTSITLAPNSVLGGTSTTGTVNLNTSAPTGGLTVQLYTTTGIAGVPTSVTVPAGQKTATFTVTTVPVSANVLTQVVGKYLGVAKPATLTVQAAAVSTVTLTPTSVKGGTNSTLTIKLTGLAGPSGLVVTLTSSNLNAATVPATVTVPAGTDTVDVVVTTKAVTANTTSTLTAKTSASSKTVVLTVTK